ncbi:hypothetical protein K435DRAFT_820740 [Dendrothele bispora CBS 962.96]|uniref:Chondroitin AC/alginate lyase n=1 Tax=Dendrothele bispora (strain CBS 962.96) TaxID=1314807 RepID=A0A4S8LRR3_DENBC|nr:hypothetical protein K435DRAFT_820740 [Dendrothele bispora CBS 962.96]
MFSKISISLLAILISQLIAVVAGIDNVTLSDIPSYAPATFKHPGVLIDRAQLDFIKGKVQSGQQPWTNAYHAMLNDPLASLTRKPSPTATVQCGPTSTPNIGCTDEREDSIAAYAMSLACYILHERMGKGHELSNAPLQTGWAGAGWTRAAEIIRWTNAGWASSDVTAFENMLRKVYLSTVIKGSQIMLETALGISIFLEDKNSYDIAMNKFLGRVPAYLLKDGDTPKTAPGSGLNTRAKIVSYWQGQSSFQADGIAQETCRDYVHTGYGLSSISHIAETSRIQGNDLYGGDVGECLRYGPVGFHSQFQIGAAPKPSWLCVDKNLKLGLGPITEIGFNALHTRCGIAMTNTQKLTEKQRPAGSNHLFVGWETLTHAGNTASDIAVETKIKFEFG